MKKFGLSLEIPSSDEEKEETTEQMQYNDGEGEDEEEESEELNSNEEEEGTKSEDKKEGISDLMVQDFSQNNSRPKLEIADCEDEASQKEEIKKEFGFPGMSIDFEEESQEDCKEETGFRDQCDDGIQIEGVESTGDLSYKWVEQIENIKIIEKGINFSQFYTNYALRMISQEFKLIK